MRAFLKARGLSSSSAGISPARNPSAWRSARSALPPCRKRRRKASQTIAPGPWLLARVPWNAAEHTIRAVAADEHVAKMLAVPRHSPCLVVQRRTWSADQPVTNVRLTYAGETHSLVARFAPQTR